MEDKRIARISVTWRGRQLDVDADPSCTVKEFGQLLQDLTSVNPETLKLIVPQSTNKGSKLITPFSDPHSVLTLKEAAISDGKPIRMMGVFNDEIEEVSDNGKRTDLRIIGFEEEEQRLRQRTSGRPQVPLKLPQGQYIFCDFRTLHLPGIELNPPPSEALKRMHMLACDPGIIAIMNKHRWRVGIMTEMAPVGYVGVSPKCILGFNKNMGEEISLRLRTDDLKGFRKYESIKRTLLHELAHMVHSEHDANFFALNKQLNDEAASLDWTKSRGHVLSGRKIFDSYEDEFVLEPDSVVVGHKLGGGSSSLASARVLSGSAAYKRFLNASADLESSKDNVNISGNEILVPGTKFEPDPDDVGQDFSQENAKVDPDPDDNDDMNVDVGTGASWSSVSRSFTEQDTICHSEPDPDDVRQQSTAGCLEPDPDDSSNVDILSRELRIDGKQNGEPDPDDNGTSKFIPEPVNKMEVETELGSNFAVLNSEPDPDDSSNAILNKKLGTDRSDETTCEAVVQECGNKMEVETEQSRNSTISKSEPDPDDHAANSNISELQRIEEPVAALCARLQKAIEMLRSQATPAEATSALQTLFKIIKNVIEHPHDTKYRRLRKSNPQFQRSVVNYKAAMEVLELIGFCEDVVSDEIGRAETYLVLKRNDPGLLWLAKSSLEVSMA
uniref:WLM domain-containing protein n=1 Tax=Oryza meridionalis TaxID=40149 RepID=A0A0E0EN38_9ORYZ